MTHGKSVVVPIEPTEAMLVAADNAGGSFAGSYLSDHDMHRIIWYAMIVNAPRREAPAPSSLAGRISREQVLAIVRQFASPSWCSVDRLVDTLLAALSPEAPARIETPIDALVKPLTPRHEAPASEGDVS